MQTVDTHCYIVKVGYASQFWGDRIWPPGTITRATMTFGVVIYTRFLICTIVSSERRTYFTIQPDLVYFCSGVVLYIIRICGCGDRFAHEVGEERTMNKEIEDSIVPFMHCMLFVFIHVHGRLAHR